MKSKWMRVLALGLVLGSLGAFVVATPQRAEGLSGSEFNAGYIISDAKFYARDVMSEGQIQTFLDSKIGGCLNANCLNVLRVSTATTTLDFGTCETYAGGVNESAARIIYKVQQACTISAQVILTTLQKEQSLVTSRAPTEAVLRKAMGQGCPDTAACDSAFYGFFLQVFTGARQMAWYGNPAGSHTSIKVGQLNARPFSPNSDCGSSNVLIQNRATASLYYYTPYQPNAAALSNLNGSGDACSSYGNRNFWVYYNNWFGPPTLGGNPIGNVEVHEGGVGGIRVGGWAFDGDSQEPIEVHVYVDGTGYRTTATGSRPDVGAAYPGAGDNRGFNLTATVPSSGNHEVCVYGINVGAGANSLFGCWTIAAQGGSPFGVLESVTSSSGVINAQGWAVDPDTAASIPVHVYVDSVSVNVTASETRSDVGSAYPGFGDQHGFSTTLSAAPGTHTVCAYAINTNWGSNALLRCVEVTVPGASGIMEKGRAPIGSLDVISGSSAGITVGGWALDPDT
ncbi:hypothetical protein SAMN05216368_11199, partial [Cryobacterium flavum]